MCKFNEHKLKMHFEMRGCRFKRICSEIFEWVLFTAICAVIRYNNVYTHIASHRATFIKTIYLFIYFSYLLFHIFLLLTRWLSKQHQLLFVDLSFD